MAEEHDVDPRVDELFTLPPDAFTAARNALVKVLRSEGGRDLAGEVGGLRRPTAAAWAINQVVRTHRDRFDALLDAGDQVRAAQRRALSGVRQSGMRDATRNRRAAIEALADAASAILTDHGVAADSHRGDIVATFDAASADEDAAALVGAARLSAALPVASGFGALDGLQLVAPPAAEPSADHAAPEPAPDGAEDAAEADTAEQEERARRDEERAKVRRAAMRAVADARRRLTDAQGTADRAEAEASRAAARAAAADQTATVAEDKARRLRAEADQLAERAARASDRAGEARRLAGRLADELEAREGELETLDD